MNKTISNIIKNYFSTMLFIGLLVFYYYTNDYYNGFLIKDFYVYFFKDNQIVEKIYNTKNIFIILIGLYSVLLIPYYYFEKEKSKARIIINYLQKKFKKNSEKITHIEKTAILAFLVKGFYAPLLVVWITENLFKVINSLVFSMQNYSFMQDNFYDYFNAYIFFGIFYLIMFIDTFYFTLGYLLESKFLKNKIKSVEPTMIGWIVALLCYPPFNLATGNILGWYSNDRPLFGDHIYHYILAILLLIFFAIYSRASIALGLKASNLTNRGIVERGPYKFVRHPAYISKNIARFIGTIPAYIIAFTNKDLKMFLLISFSFFGWTIIYFLRAYTEEKHLEKDPEYIKYQNKVKYKFIPGIW